MSSRYSTTVTSGTTPRVVVTSGATTQVKKVVVGTPVRRVSGGASTSINNLAGINTRGAEQGDVLVYNATTTNWEATKKLEEQNINGGSY